MQIANIVMLMYLYVHLYVYLNVYASDVCLQRIVTLKNNYYEASQRNRVKICMQFPKIMLLLLQ